MNLDAFFMSRKFLMLKCPNQVQGSMTLSEQKPIILFSITELVMLTVIKRFTFTFILAIISLNIRRTAWKEK